MFFLPNIRDLRNGRNAKEWGLNGFCISWLYSYTYSSDLLDYERRAQLYWRVYSVRTSSDLILSIQFFSDVTRVSVGVGVG